MVVEGKKNTYRFSVTSHLLFKMLGREVSVSMHVEDGQVLFGSKDVNSGSVSSPVAPEQIPNEVLEEFLKALDNAELEIKMLLNSRS